MTHEPHVVAICGSLRDESTTRLALSHALAAADDAGASTELIDLRQYDLPVFDADDRDVGDAARLKAAVGSADGVILGSPMYHGSYSGVLKNALDYLGSDEFEGATVGLLGVAGGSFPRTVLDHLRTVSRSVGAWTLPHQVAIPNASSQFEDGRIVDEALAERVATLGTEVVDYAGLERFPAHRSDRATAAPVDD
ncbi:MAG: NADPH-dependent FMN reductase [Halanaeroarchaeum sp.]